MSSFFDQFEDAWQFAATCFPEYPEFYRWQIEELLRLSGYCDPYDPATRYRPSKESPLLYTLCAANGSGKDQILIALWALYCVCCEQWFHMIVTSASYTQLDEQTWRHIKAGAEQINRICPEYLTITKHKIKCRATKSEITLYRTDESGKTEGWHPLKEGAPMAIVLNEIKSIDGDLVVSFKRCHGYTHWINISSPGEPQGYFYERCTSLEHAYPDIMVPGKPYFRRIDYTECPHLAAEYQRDVAEFGENHPYILSSYLAQFSSTALLCLIDPGRYLYQYPEKSTLGLPRRAGVDLALGGDSTVISIWEGNHPIKEIELNESFEPRLTPLIVGHLIDNGVSPNHTYADAGGLGAPIIQRIVDAGFAINAVHNQGAPRNKRAFYNRGAELAWNFRRLVYDRLLNLKDISARLKRQLPLRRYEMKNGKIILEAKADFRKRVGFSPDHLDSAVLAHAGVFHEMLREDTSPEAVIGDSTKYMMEEFNELYGNIDNARARASAYRTSGAFGTRRFEKPVEGIADRLGAARSYLGRKPRRL